MDPITHKNILRKELKNKRREFIQTHGAKLLKSLSESLAIFFKSSIPLAPSSTIAGYWPLAEELDCRPLLLYFHEQNHICTLPCVEDLSGVLIFRKWAPSDSLELCPLFSSSFRLMQPHSKKEKLLPDIVLVPLLGFSSQGYRIGYGAGLYDATLRLLRTQKRIIAVGVGYTCQEISSFPHESHDEKLDYVLTEQGVRSFAA